MVSLVNGNGEAAKAFCGQALLIEPAYDDARQTLKDFLGSADTDAFVRKVGKGMEFLKDDHLKKARRLLKADKLAEADGFVQKACAIMNPEYAILADYATCLANAKALHEAGKLESQITERIDNLRTLWAQSDETAVHKAEEHFSVAQDRKQFAAIVSEVLQRRNSDAAACFELGCFSGFNLNLVKDTLGAKPAARVSFHGLEPNPSAVAYCKENYPFIDIHCGTHEDMISDRVPLPEVLEVCMVGRVFQMLYSDDVTAVMAYLSGRARYLVIADDVVNIDGPYPIIRTPLYIMHNFRMPLEAAGFAIEEVVFADAPDRSCTGFIVARNDGLD